MFAELCKVQGYHSFQLKVTFYWWVGGGCGSGGGGGGGWLSFLFFGQERGCKKKTYNVGGHERKNALLKISPALPHFSKHNKCNLSNQTNSFATQREDKCWSRIEELILITNSNVLFSLILQKIQLMTMQEYLFRGLMIQVASSHWKQHLLPFFLLMDFHLALVTFYWKKVFRVHFRHLIHSFIHPSIHPFIRPSVPFFLLSFLPCLLACFLPSLLPSPSPPSFISSFVRLFIHSFIHLFVGVFLCSFTKRKFHDSPSRHVVFKWNDVM